MRASVLIGLALVAVGFVALYQVKNGFLMSSLSVAYYAPPEDPAELQPAFDELGGIEAADGGFYLRQIAQAWIVCTLRQMTELPEDAAIEAFRRLNLMLLGAGVNSLSGDRSADPLHRRNPSQLSAGDGHPVDPAPE